MTSVIKASEFVKYLKKEGLVIVSQKELDNLSGKKLLQNRNDLLNKKWLTIRELLSLELLPVKSKQAIRKWIENGIISSKEVLTDSRGIIKISTSFLNRQGYV